MAIIHNEKYKRIAKVETVATSNVPFANVMLEIYDNAEDREKTKTGEEFLVKGWDYVFLDSDFLELTDETNFFEKLYNKIKQKEEFQGCIDV